MEEQQLLVHHLDLGVQQGQLRLDSDALLEPEPRPGYMDSALMVLLGWGLTSTKGAKG